MNRYNVSIKELFNTSWDGTTLTTINCYEDLWGLNFNKAYLTRLLGTNLADKYFDLSTATGNLTSTGIYENILDIEPKDTWSVMFWKYFIPKALEMSFSFNSSIDTENVLDLKNVIASRFYLIFSDKKDYFSMRITQYAMARDALLAGEMFKSNDSSSHTITDAAATDTSYSKHSDTPTTTQNPSGNSYVSDRTDASTSIGARSRTDTGSESRDNRLLMLENLEKQIYGVYSEWADYIINKYMTVDW